MSVTTFMSRPEALTPPEAYIVVCFQPGSKIWILMFICGPLTRFEYLLGNFTALKQ